MGMLKKSAIEFWWIAYLKQGHGFKPCPFPCKNICHTINPSIKTTGCYCRSIWIVAVVTSQTSLGPKYWIGPG